ncbi:MAG: metal-dependent hydrolase [Xanthobacteraceae bacterium]|nr:metal-dependent hydrolase [Xanthobacteraceae bacterium]
MKLVWLGHSAFHIELAGKSILVDPFFAGNSKYPAQYEDSLKSVDVIALTHGHRDHIGDTARLAKKYGSVVAAQPEICTYLGKSGVEKFQQMNIGGTVKIDGLSISMVNAEHSSSIVEGGQIIPLGDPAGLVFRDGTNSIYHAGDTGLFSDMKLIERLYSPKIGLIPMGDRFTMGPESAAIACNEFLELDYIVPIHWGTFGLLTGDPDVFAGLVKRGKVLRPEPGKPIDFK